MGALLHVDSSRANVEVCVACGTTAVFTMEKYRTNSGKLAYVQTKFLRSWLMFWFMKRL